VWMDLINVGGGIMLMYLNICKVKGAALKTKGPRAVTVRNWRGLFKKPSQGRRMWELEIQFWDLKGHRA
jgi:hypothetical protein